MGEYVVMQCFGAPLTSKEQLDKYTKEQLMDMFWGYTKDVNYLLDHLLNCSDKERNEMKSFFNAMKQVEKMEKQEKENIIKELKNTTDFSWLLGLLMIARIFNNGNNDKTEEN